MVSWSQVRGHALHFSQSSVGCRTLQQILLNSTYLVADEMYLELRPAIGMIMSDEYGNYLFQKLLVATSHEKKKMLVSVVEIVMEVI